MKSKKYNKYHVSKYQFPTRAIHGARVESGAVAALAHIQAQLGRRLTVAKTDHTRGEWVFCELRGQANG